MKCPEGAADLGVAESRRHMANVTDSRSVQLEGLVLVHRDFSDSHRIVEVLTAEEGRISLLARGGRRSRRRFSGALDLFVTLRMQVRASGNLWTLSSAEVLRPRIGIRSDLASLARATQLLELARHLSPEREGAPTLLAVLSDALDRIDAGDTTGAALAYPAMLKVAGVLPEVERCAQCGSPGRPGRIVDGEFICTGCRPGRGAIGPGALATWRGEPPPDEETARGVENSILDYAEAALGIRMKSRHLSM